MTSNGERNKAKLLKNGRDYISTVRYKSVLNVRQGYLSVW